MANYVDGFIFPVPREHLSQYQQVAKKVASIWKEYGALAYYEYVGDDLQLEGTRSFTELMDATDQDSIIFGWVVFESKAARDLANQKVPADARMAHLIAPLTDPSRIIFDAKRMVYGGFKTLVQ